MDQVTRMLWLIGKKSVVHLIVTQIAYSRSMDLNCTPKQWFWLGKRYCEIKKKYVTFDNVEKNWVSFCVGGGAGVVTRVWRGGTLREIVLIRSTTTGRWWHCNNFYARTWWASGRCNFSVNFKIKNWFELELDRKKIHHLLGRPRVCWAFFAYTRITDLDLVGYIFFAGFGRWSWEPDPDPCYIDCRFEHKKINKSSVQFFCHRARFVSE
jgi:hypothetical protein